MVKGREDMSFMQTDDYLDEIHVRILRVTEDLRAIQRELNFAVMEAPGDPELMEALSKLPEMESLHLLRSSLDQMRHFLWFYMQVMTNEAGAECLQPEAKTPAPEEMVSPETAVLDKFKITSDAAMLRYLSESKNRKPN